MHSNSYHDFSSLREVRVRPPGFLGMDGLTNNWQIEPVNNVERNTPSTPRG